MLKIILPSTSGLLVSGESGLYSAVGCYRFNQSIVSLSLQDALEASSAGWSMWAGGGALGRSTSSAGERHSATYQSPALPRRADTFAGFDAQQHRGKCTNIRCDIIPYHIIYHTIPFAAIRCNTIPFDAIRYDTRRALTNRAGEWHSGKNLCCFLIFIQRFLTLVEQNIVSVKFSS